MTCDANGICINDTVSCIKPLLWNGASCVCPRGAQPIGFDGNGAICPVPQVIVAPTVCTATITYAPNAPDVPTVTMTPGCDLAGGQIALLAAALWAALQGH